MKMSTNSMTLPAWADLEKRLQNVPGWSPLDQLYTIYTLILFAAPAEGDCLEIGSWCGRSSIVLGLAARIRNKKLHCIDLFPGKDDWYRKVDGTYYFVAEINGKKYGGYQSQTVYADAFNKSIAPLYEKKDSVRDYFDESIAANELSSVVCAYRGDSLICNDLKRRGTKVALAFIDGDHSYEATCQDIEQVESLLVPGGILCFDDAFSFYDGVNQAITDRIINNPAYTVKQQMTRKCFVAKKG